MVGGKPEQTTEYTNFVLTLLASSWKFPQPVTRVAMGKRRLSDKARTRSCYDHASEDEACSDNSRASNYEDTLARRKTHRKRHKSSHEAIEFGKRPVNPNSNAISHSRSSHNIQSPDSIRVALLRWYAGVYASRGMPWRKLCDPSEGVSGRAQRAYKVQVSYLLWILV